MLPLAGSYTAEYSTGSRTPPRFCQPPQPPEAVQTSPHAVPSCSPVPKMSRLPLAGSTAAGPPVRLASGACAPSAVADSMVPAPVGPSEADPAGDRDAAVQVPLLPEGV